MTATTGGSISMTHAPAIDMNKEASLDRVNSWKNTAMNRYLYPTFKRPVAFTNTIVPGDRVRLSDLGIKQIGGGAALRGEALGAITIMNVTSMNVRWDQATDTISYDMRYLEVI
jgi:hypothetical protein